MDKMSGGQWFCLLIVGFLVVGAVLIAVADAFSKRKTSRDQEDPFE